MSKSYGLFKIINDNSGSGSNGSRLFDVQFIDTGYIATRVRKDHIKDGHIKDHSYMDVVGKTFTSKNYGDFKVLYEVRRTSHNIRYKIEFIKTGFQTEAWLNNIRQGEIIDPLYPKVRGVGYLGLEYDKIRKQDRELYNALKSKWSSMLNRCYNEKYVSYHLYGGNNICVDERWHNFCNFYNDVQTLHGFNREDIINCNGIHLDKDLKQIDVSKNKRIYSKDTCTWLKPNENILICKYEQLMSKHEQNE